MRGGEEDGAGQTLESAPRTAARELGRRSAPRTAA